MKIRSLLLAILFLFALNIPLAYAFDFLEENEQEPPLKYLYDRNIAVGLELLENKKYSDAKFEFEKAKFLFPEFPESYINLAIIHINRYEYNQAQEELSQAKKLAKENYPKKYIIFYNLGLCAYQKENYQEAVDYFSQCLELKPGLKEALNGLNLAQQNILRKPEPQEITEREEIDPQTITKTIYAKDLDAISKDSQTPQSHKTLEAMNLLRKASAHFKNNETEKAIDCLQQSISLNPNNPQAHYRLGVIYAYLNNFDLAAEYFEEAIKQDPSFVKSYINLGAAYGKLKNYPEAIRVLNKALKVDKNNAKIYYNLGMIASGAGKVKEAKKHFKKARALASKDNDTALLGKIPKL